MMKFMTSKTDKPAVMKLEMINARLPQGTGERIDRVLKGGELRSAFIRAAIEAELERRENDSAHLSNR